MQVFLALIPSADIKNKSVTIRSKLMLKKMMLVALTGLMLLSLCACGEREESVSVKDADIYKEYKIEETKITEKDDFSSDGISVTVGAITYDDVTTRINMHIENDREEKVTVTTAELSINDLMSADSMIVTLESGSEKDSYIQISNQWFGEMNIKTIKEIEFLIKVYDEKDNEITKSDVLHIKTDAPWTYKQKYNDEGYTIYKEKDITISVMGLKKSALSNDMELVFYIENKTDKSLSVMSSDVSVNGASVEPLFVMSVGPKKKAVDSMLFYEKDLTECKISEIKFVKASFKAFDENLETVFKTDVIEIPVK